MINELAKQIHQNAIDKGFYEDGKATNMGERIALIHAEVSEALEADRKGLYCSTNMEELMDTTISPYFQFNYENYVKGTFEEEMADIAIRVMETCAYLKIDLEAHIAAKMKYNSVREKRHGKRY